MQEKARGGPELLNNIDKIVEQFVTADNYTTSAELDTVAERNREAIRDAGYELLDASHLLEGIKNGLKLLELWATAVHTARTSKQMLFFRRTPENNAALLLLQRLEHLRNMERVTEMTPLAYAVLVRDDQMLVTRDQVGSAEHVDAELSRMARTELLCPLCQTFTRAKICTVLDCGHVLHSDCYTRHLESSNVCPVCRENVNDVKPVEIELADEIRKFKNRNTERDYNMPTPLFTQEISLIRELQKSDLCKPCKVTANGEKQCEDETANQEDLQKPEQQVEVEQKGCVVDEHADNVTASSSGAAPLTAEEMLAKCTKDVLAIV